MITDQLHLYVSFCVNIMLLLLLLLLLLLMMMMMIMLMMMAMTGVAATWHRHQDCCQH